MFVVQNNCVWAKPYNFAPKQIQTYIWGTAEHANIVVSVRCMGTVRIVTLRSVNKKDTKIPLITMKP